MHKSNTGTVPGNFYICEAFVFILNERVDIQFYIKRTFIDYLNPSNSNPGTIYKKVFLNSHIFKRIIIELYQVAV